VSSIGVSRYAAGYAPIVLFVYNRPHHTEQTIAALQANELAPQSNLIIFADGAKKPEHTESVNAVRRLIDKVSGFKTVEIRASEHNKGLAESITQGVTQVVKQYGKVIVLEDDIVVAPTFLNFMNDALHYYQDCPKVWHVAGWTYPIELETDKDVYFYRLMQCWGWATWADRWAHFEKDVDSMLNSYDKPMRKRFNIDGYDRIWNQVAASKKGKINTWAVFWYATIFNKNGLCLCPTQSYVKNVGHGDGEHCKDQSRLDNTQLNTNKRARFSDDLAEDATIINQIKVHLAGLKTGYFARLKLYLRTHYNYFV